MADATRIDVAALARELERDEACKLRPYRCSAGKLTIGIGRNLDDVGISRAEADMLFANDVERVMRELDATLPWWKEMDGVRQRVLINMAFNMGIARLLEFRLTLKLMQNREYARAAEEMLNSLWAKQVGARAERLSDMMRKGST